MKISTMEEVMPYLLQVFHTNPRAYNNIQIAYANNDKETILNYVEALIEFFKSKARDLSVEDIQIAEEVN